jgi:imidazolonepropionase-like amidohydrolase
MFRVDIPMLAGTDTGNPYCFPGFSLHDELAVMVESGVGPLGALPAATGTAAIFMDATDKYRSASPGRIAGLVRTSVSSENQRSSGSGWRPSSRTMAGLRVFCSKKKLKS